MVTTEPAMSTSCRSCGIAVISFDFSSQTAWPSDRPSSLARTLTECGEPSPAAFVAAPEGLAVDAEDGTVDMMFLHRLELEGVEPGREAGLEYFKVHKR